MNKVFLSLCLLSLLSSCVGTKLATSTSTKSVQEVLKGSYEKSAQLSWFTSQLKGQAQLNTQNYPINAQLRMKKDSIIWLSLSAVLGLEALRVQLTPDSIKVINRLNSSYFIGDISTLSKTYNIPLSFSEIQDALLGVCRPNPSLDFELKKGSNDYLLFAESNSNAQHFRLNANYLPIEISRSRADSQRVNLTYTNFTLLEDQWLPNDLSIEALSNENALNIFFSYSKMTINRPKKIKFSIPSSYAPM